MANTYGWGVVAGLALGLNLANIINMSIDKVKVYSLDLNKDSKNEIVVSHRGRDKVFFPQSDGTYRIADDVFEDLKKQATLRYDQKILAIETEAKKNLADLLGKDQYNLKKKAMVQQYKAMHQDAKKAYQAEINSLESVLESYENGGK